MRKRYSFFSRAHSPMYRSHPMRKKLHTYVLFILSNFFILFTIVFYATNYFLEPYEYLTLVLLTLGILSPFGIPDITSASHKKLWQLLFVNFFFSFTSIVLGIFLLLTLDHESISYDLEPRAFFLMVGIVTLLLFLLAYHILMSIFLFFIRLVLRNIQINGGIQSKRNISLFVSTFLLCCSILVSGIPLVQVLRSYHEIGGIYYTVNGKIYALIQGNGLINAARVEIPQADAKTFRYVLGTKDEGAMDRNYFYWQGKVVRKEFIADFLRNQARENHASP